MNKPIMIIGITLFFLLCTMNSKSFSAEQLTITTYYPSPYGSYQDLEVNHRLLLGGGAASTYWTDEITGYPSGMHGSDRAVFIPVHRGVQSDLRLYILDDLDDKFSIWGYSCYGGGNNCQNIDKAQHIASFNMERILLSADTVEVTRKLNSSYCRAYTEGPTATTCPDYHYAIACGNGTCNNPGTLAGPGNCPQNGYMICVRHAD